MRKKLLKVMLVLIVFAVIFTGCATQDEEEIITIPGLPQPIAKETVLITSAGQCTDTYIIKDIANELMIHNFFMPQAGELDLKDIKSIVFVVGFSPMGEKLHGIKFEDEKRRIEKLLQKAESEKLKMIAIFIGGKERRGYETDELLRLICPKTDYIIGMWEANYDNFFADMAGKNNIPLTLVKDVSDVSEPFASAFR